MTLTEFFNLKPKQQLVRYSIWEFYRALGGKKPVMLKRYQGVKWSE